MNLEQGWILKMYLGFRVSQEPEPGIEVVSDGNEGRRLHDNILPVEDSLPPMAVHYPVLVCVDQELSGPC